MDLKSGDVVEGRVAEIRPFGAFVWLGEGKKGLIHISEISEEFVKDVREKVRPNQKVRVKILSVSEDGRIECSLKQVEKSEFSRPRAEELEPDELPVPVPEALIGEPPEISFEIDESELVSSHSFEELIKRFKRMSEENLTDVKRRTEAKRGAKKKPRRRRLKESE